MLGQATTTYHQFARLQSLSEWWQWLVMIVVCVAVAAYVFVMYRRDSVELRRGLAWLLVALRIGAFLGILFFYLDLERRAERRIVKNSRVHVLVDTSQSMGLRDSAEKGSDSRSRLELVANELGKGDLITNLRKDHDVVVHRFDQGMKAVELATYRKIPSADDLAGQPNETQEAQDNLRQARATAMAAGVLLVISMLAGLLSLLARLRAAPRRPSSREAGGEPTSWALLVSMVTLIGAVVVLAVAALRTPGFNVLVTLGVQEPALASDQRRTNEDAESETPAPTVDWAAELTPRGVESRINEVLQQVVNKERGGPIAGIVLFTDGQQNPGLDCDLAVASAQEAGIPIYAVGVGSDKRPQNIRVVDVEAPQRVYPGDKFTVTGLLQAVGYKGRSIRVELVSGADAGAAGKLEEEQRISLGADGEMQSVRFELTPEEVGKINYKVRVILPEPDHDVRDNERTTSVEIVERKNKVLVIAGGPSREYQFLNKLLFRDKETTVDVWLQSGVEGISQESNELLFEFPETAEELFEYDCIVGFDPNWELLDDDQARLLERWVAEEAGGLIVVAGPVFTPQWSARRPGDIVADTIKGLYPVAFYYQGAATLSLGRFGGDRAWPLQFTRDGLDSQFLWLADTATTSEQNWTSFEGVYGYYAVKDPKPGARILARFSDPDTELDGQLPIYLANHFYGAGRVVFQASGEMWRVRAVDDTFFDQYYTKLIRWVSQGRLQRDSRRGVLLVDKDRCVLGDHISVRAILKDPQLRPLADAEVAANLVLPDGQRTPLKMRQVKDTARGGMYSAQFTALLEGDYRVEVNPPQSAGDELLVREVKARVPAREIERPERNDALLTNLTQKTGGEYFLGVDAAMNRQGGGQSIASVLEPQDQTSFLPGTPDKNFERALMTWLMGLICGVLSLEWLIRRLSKLA